MKLNKFFKIYFNQIILFITGILTGYYLYPLLNKIFNTFVVGGQEGGHGSAEAAIAQHAQETIQQAREFYINYHNTVKNDAENWKTSYDRAEYDECYHTSDDAMEEYSPGKRVICRALHEAYTMSKVQHDGDIRNVDLSLSVHERAAEAANNCKEKLETLLGSGITIDKDISDSRCDDLINICQWTQNKHTGKCSSE
tara:strand:- start:741 stop:1331 length:591 start_codon:yes stop_codon:yes gene_type:complete